MIRLFNKFKRRRSGRGGEIFVDEILLDSKNLPAFNRYQFEGRLEKPIGRRVIMAVAVLSFGVFLVFISRIFFIQIVHGEDYKERSLANRLREVPIFPNRGVIYDRGGAVLVDNIESTEHPEFSSRIYRLSKGLAHVLGFVSYPKKDQSGYYYKFDSEGRDGVELLFNETLSGRLGVKLIEVDALGRIVSESVIYPPIDGKSIYLSIDKDLNHFLFEQIASLAERVGFTGGGGVIMDVKTGEIIALTSFPEFDSSVLSEGKDEQKIRNYLDSQAKPFLNRVTDGLYTPGSIVKPLVAVGALEEGIIDPNKAILSTGSISLPNPYNPNQKSVFKDWRAHGWVDMRRAIAVSSNIYFYEIGGGFENQAGLGIKKLEKYFRLFGLGAPVPGDIFPNKAGVIPTPQWKTETFADNLWRIGDTYNTAIGQYGFLVTALQMVRAVGAIANNGFLLEPTLLKNTPNRQPVGEWLPVKAEHFQIVREGMREGVLSGTAAGLYFSDLAVAAKTGTAEIDDSKKFVNSWVTGFFPYEEPRYAFAVVMERGPRGNVYGALSVMNTFLNWLKLNKPEYVNH
jgi:penicillin-binding protein 2